MKKTIKLAIVCILLLSCLTAFASCGSKKQYTSLEASWILDDETTSVIVIISNESKTHYITFLDNNLESKAITGTFSIEGKELIVSCQDENELSQLGGADGTLTVPYTLSEDGKNLTLSYAGKTVELIKFDKDLSNVPSFDQIPKN